MDENGKKEALKGLLKEVGSWKKEALREKAPKKPEAEKEDEAEDEDEVVIKLLGKLAKQKKGE